MNIIAISGKLCSGKSALARNLCERLEGAEIISLAGALKTDIVLLAGADITNDNKHFFRPVLQSYGSLMRGLYGADYWLNRCLHTAQERGLRTLVVDDVRYPNELMGLYAATIRTQGRFFSVRLQISPDVQLQRYSYIYGTEPEPGFLEHPSETALDANSFVMAFDALLSGELEREIVALAVWERLKNMEEFVGEPVG